MFPESTCLRTAAGAARRNLLLFSLLLCVLIFPAGLLYAQSASMTGLITDPSGAAIPHAKITLTNESTHAVRKITSDNNGVYNVPHVPAGTYTLAVDAPGFKHYEKTDIDVSSAQTLAFDAHLQLGSASQSVTVNGAQGYVANNSSTGMKTDTPLIETPQSISVVTQQQLEDQDPQSVGQALRYTAGIVPEPNGVHSFVAGAGNDLLRLRGFVPDTYLDGLSHDSYNGNNGTFLDPYLLDRVEVVNGPASVLYGQASPGGFVDMESKLPTERPLHEVQLGTGSYGQYQGAFDLSGPIRPNKKFLYRLTGISMTENSQVNFTKTQEIAIAPTFTWRPGADTSFTVMGKYQNYPRVGGYSPVPAIGTVLPNPNGKIPTSFFSGDPNYNDYSNTLASVGYSIDHRFNTIWSVRQKFYYEHNTKNYSTILPLSLSSNDSTLSRYAYFMDEGFDTIDVDNQIEADFRTRSIRHTVVAGIDYQRFTDFETYGGDFTYPSINMFAPVYYLPVPSASSFSHSTLSQVQNQIGVYAQDQLSIGQWRIVAGGRGDYATEKSVTTSLLTNAVTNQTNYSQSAPSWRVGLLYLFHNGFAPYASYTTSFQPQAGATYGGTAFKPTTAEQYEAGIKYQPSGWNSFITAALYNLTEQNVTTVDPSHTGFSTQTGEVRSRGVELQGHASLTNNLDLIATYTYSNVINTESNTTGTSISGVTESEQ